MRGSRKFCHTGSNSDNVFVRIQIPLKVGHHRLVGKTSFKWRFAGGPLNASLVALWFLAIQTSIAMTPNIFVIFHGWGSGPTAPLWICAWGKHLFWLPWYMHKTFFLARKIRVSAVFTQMWKFYLTYPVLTRGNDTFYVNTYWCYATSHRIQDLEKAEFNSEQEKIIHYLCEDVETLPFWQKLKPAVTVFKEIVFSFIPEEHIPILTLNTNDVC